MLCDEKSATFIDAIFRTGEEKNNQFSHVNRLIFMIIKMFYALTSSVEC